ncbi:MAG: hypothetical protein QG608_1185 [Actinomycetota bacterium]|nr:hypothetical protein [Actinomycetota bacterium]
MTDPENTCGGEDVRTTHRMPPATLRECLASGTDLRVLDVRTPAEFRASHIPGAWNVPLDSLGECRSDLVAGLSGSVVLVCRSGARAERAAAALQEAGLASMSVLDGGLTAWEREGGELKRGRRGWELERQVRLAAGSLVVLGILGSLVVPGLQWLSAFVGAGLVFAAVTGTCGMALILARMPWNRAAPDDVRAVIAQLAACRRPDDR